MDKYCRGGVQCYDCSFKVAKHLVAYGPGKKQSLLQGCAVGLFGDNGNALHVGLVPTENSSIMQDAIRPVWTEMEEQGQGFSMLSQLFIWLCF